MPRVSTYLNFPRSTEDAFSFYRSVFKTDFCAPIARFKDIPLQPGCPPLAEADQDLVMHVELPILGGHVLMGTDAPESMGFTLTPGNNVSINLEPDTRAETERLFEALSDRGKIEMPLQEMFWGGYFGSLTDRFGVRWMFNCASKTWPTMTSGISGVGGDGSALANLSAELAAQGIRAICLRTTLTLWLPRIAKRDGLLQSWRMTNQYLD